MKPRAPIAIAILISVSLAAPSPAAVGKGDPAPPFELEATSGKSVSSSGLGDSGIALVAFLSLDSKPSRELAITLSDLVKEHGKEGLSVVAIAGDPAEALKEFTEQHALGYPVCPDPSRETLKRYGAEHVVPVTVVIGPGGMIAKVIRGGGSVSQQVLLAVAEKEFARGDAAVAARLYGEAAADDPKNAQALAGSGFALAKQGKLERAEEEFRLVGELGAEGKRLAAEGLAEVALRRGDLEGALEKASRSEGSYAALVRGEVAARRGRLDEAEKEFRVAGGRSASFPWQQAVAFNNLARISREKGDVKTAVQTYDRAIAEEPFLVAARSNKAVALERAGRPEEAKKTLAAARRLAPSDQLVASLLRRLEEREAEKLDLERQKLASQLVSELAEAFRSDKLPERPGDEWSPRKLVVSFLDVRDQLGPLAPDGLADAFVLNLVRRLQESGRAQVVEREIIDKLLAELKLGSSELADPATRLKVGRVLAATVIATGAFHGPDKGTELRLRLIDTETTEIRQTISERLDDPTAVATFAEKIGDRIEKLLRAEYPMRAKIASVDGDEIIVGLGRKHGARAGARLQVVEDGEPVEVDGEVVGHRQRKVGLLELTDVEDGFAYAKTVDGGDFEKGQKVVEAAAGE